METIENLKDGVYAYINEYHRFGTDSLLLKNFAKIKKGDRVCDLGTGCGIISLLIAKDRLASEILAVDIQKDAIELLEKSIEKSNLNGKIQPLRADIKDIKTQKPYDVIVCNPPYKAMGTGIKCPNKQRLVARHEVDINIEDICKKSAQMLKYGGKLVISQRIERLVDTLISMRKFKLEPKEMMLCAKDENTPPWLILIEARYGGKPFLKVKPAFFVYGQDGSLNKINI